MPGGELEALLAPERFKGYPLLLLLLFDPAALLPLFPLLGVLLLLGVYLELILLGTTGVNRGMAGYVVEDREEGRVRWLRSMLICACVWRGRASGGVEGGGVGVGEGVFMLDGIMMN